MKPRYLNEVGLSEFTNSSGFSTLRACHGFSLGSSSESPGYFLVTRLLYSSTASLIQSSIANAVMNFYPRNLM
jgi:hypothetical protein